MLSYSKKLIITLLALFIIGCSSAPEPEEGSEVTNTTETEDVVEDNGPWDPFEGFNRTMWTVNYDYLDPYFVRPVSLAYVNYTPKPVRTGISNFLSNLDEPSSMVNDLIMGNGELAFTHFNRFLINTTFGLLGLIDIAGEVGITNPGDRSFSDAIGHYGVGNGPYVMIPAYGPATPREVTNLVDDSYVPLSYLNFWAGLGKWALEGMESRAALVSQEPLLEASPDPYIFTRDAYIQHLDFKAQVTSEDSYDEEEEELLDDYLDEFE